MRLSRRTLLLLVLAVVSLCLGIIQLLAPKKEVAGKVWDDDAPVIGARVRWKGHSESTLTDPTGSFSLPRRPNGARRITASKEGYLIEGALADTFPRLLMLRPLPKEDNADYDWIPPGPDDDHDHRCARCHDEIHREWSASGHARSATGRHFRNLYEGTDWKGKPDVSWGLLTQHPDGSGVCTACHAPTVRPGDPAQFDLTKVQGVSSRGVHCDYCHKVTGTRGDEFGLTHGRDMLALLRPKEGRLFFGPLDDVDRGEDSFSPFYRDSRYCAACHEGVVFGVPVYTTYSEWRDSPAGRAGRQCQDCHMKPTGRMTNIAPGNGGIERDPWTLANHAFFAGSHEEMLRDCLKLDGRLWREPAEVRVEVILRAEGVGHRVPTGYIDRHLILIVEALDRRGEIVKPLAGPLLPAPVGADWTGRPGKLFARILTNEAGHSPAPFWRPTTATSDTRLSPDRPERLAWAFPPSVERIRVRVVYRRFWQEVARAKGWPDRDVLIVERAWTTAGRD